MAAMPNRVASQKHNVLEFDKRIHLAQTTNMVVIHHFIKSYQYSMALLLHRTAY